MLSIKPVLKQLITKIEEITATDKFRMSFQPGATAEEISSFEQNSSIIFPDDYKEWLKYTDGCELFDNSTLFYGVAHQPYIDIIPEGVSDEYTEIGFAFGDPICILNGSQSIFQYGETIIEYPNFLEFLKLVINIGERK